MRFPNRFIYPFIVLIIILLYGKSIWYEYVIDDKIMITENANVSRGVVAISDIFAHTTFYGFKDYKSGTDKTYRPLTLSTYAVEISLFGAYPSVHHAFNVFYYILLCLLLYYLFSCYLFNDKQKWIALAISLFFAIHPIHTEVVCNIKSRDEILCLLLLISSLIFLFSALKEVHSRKRNVKLLLSSVLYFACLFTKETAVSFILLFPLTIWVFSADVTKKTLKKFSLIFGLYCFWLCLYLLIRYHVITSVENTIIAEVSILNNALLEYGFFQRYLMIFYILLLYIKLLVFPHPLVWDYSLGYFQFGPTILILGLLSFILHAVLLIVAIKGLKNRSLWSYCILFYLVSISLASNVFIPISSTMGERFLFSPSVAFCIALVLFADFMYRKWKFSSRANLWIVFVLGLFAIFLILKTFFRSDDWKNEQTLITSDHQYTQSLRSHISYIEVMTEEIGRNPADLQLHNDLYKEMRMILADYPEKEEKAQLWYVHGNALLKMNKQQESIQSYQHALQLNPDHLDAMFNMATVYHVTGELELAMEHYFKVIAKADQPMLSYIMSLGNIGMIYHVKGFQDLAKKYYEDALKLGTPDNNVKIYYQRLLAENNVK